MSDLIRLCPTAAVSEGEPLAVTVPGFPPLAVYEVEGAYFVTDDMCTHGKARLSDGFHDGFVIECPLHGGSFDIRTGAPKTAPCAIALRTYLAMIDDDWIAIALPSDAR